MELLVKVKGGGREREKRIWGNREKEERGKKKEEGSGGEKRGVDTEDRDEEGKRGLPSLKRRIAVALMSILLEHVLLVPEVQEGNPETRVPGGFADEVI